MYFVLKKVVSLHSKRCGSSAWLEYMPVTHGVAGSSPVRTAKRLSFRQPFLFVIINR